MRPMNVSSRETKLNRLIRMETNRTDATLKQFNNLRNRQAAAVIASLLALSPLAAATGHPYLAIVLAGLPLAAGNLVGVLALLNSCKNRKRV